MAAAIVLLAPGVASFLLLLFISSSSSFSSSSFSSSFLTSGPDQCPWTFFSCERRAGSECRMILRRQCNCSTLIKSVLGASRNGQRPPGNVLRTECVGIGGEQFWNVSSDNAIHILQSQRRRHVVISEFCDIKVCKVVASWCAWSAWKTDRSDCRYRVISQRQWQCCHPVYGHRLPGPCPKSREVKRLRKPKISDCLKINFNSSDNRTAPTSSVKDSNRSQTGELTYAYLAIGLFIMLCFLIAFPYRHIYRLCSSESPDSSHCSTPNDYEQVPMEVQMRQLASCEDFAQSEDLDASVDMCPMEVFVSVEPSPQTQEEELDSDQIITKLPVES